MTNGQGNYVGKRTPKALVKPLEPRERFARLVAKFLSCRKTYRNRPELNV